MAAGINDTFRQVGVAVGVAVWGAIFVGQGAAKVSDLTAGTPTASGDHPRQLVEAASSGSLHQALAALPPQARSRRSSTPRARASSPASTTCSPSAAWSASRARCWPSGWSASATSSASRSSRSPSRESDAVPQAAAA